ncbi:hypothetical protein WICPIJ_003060 [Wickerhamomyces pijperi]|uniref:Presequence protease, mitochondrial n=1 Tax=Wickerhamomyces pijperi TaxID=599730 RepID=A0A9P8Q7T1_WICPI|nr:hypothetical protein WICPIJ_003060 [Wickerhamomyces pijperi]
MLRHLSTKRNNPVRFASSYNQAKSLRKYPVGSNLHGFEIQRVLPVPELSLTAVDLVHLRTGSNHIHIDRDDANSVFSIAFKTNPPNATGVPHILEHTTLCGSYKYPVRDPFFKMLNRSLSNFMNAMTGHDYTFFPFATTNSKDFENLRNVYLDSVLNPLLKKEDFYQEGWRLENEDVENKSSPLTFKGVVYNEMKGQVSNASYLYWIKFQEAIFPSLNNSGGDPTKITDLTYEDLLDFHQAHYHPSNAKTFTYGTLPLTETLKKLDNEYISFGKRTIKESIKEPIKLSESQTVTVKGPVDPMAPEGRQLKASITWKAGVPTDVYESFCLKILSTLLTDGHSSPLYKALIESGMGDDFTVNSGFESQTSANFFTVGLQGLKTVEELEATVTEVLKFVSETGFEDKKVQGILQMLELGKKDQKANFGMNILYGILPGWVNKVDAFDALAFEEVIEQFKIDYAKGGLFENLIKKYFLNKPVFRFVMEPSAEYEAEVKAEEDARLITKIASLEEDDRDVIFERGQHLAKKQSEAEDLSSLPTLKISDIPRIQQFHTTSLSETSDAEIHRRIADTNGVTYVRASREVELPYELYPYLSLFTDSLTNLGTSAQPMDQIEDEIKLYTGGLSSSVSVHSSPLDTTASLKFNFGGLSLDANSGHIYRIWNDLLLNTDFNNREKLSTLIRMLSSNNISGVAESGHQYAKGFAAAGISQAKSIEEQIGGVNQLRFLNKLSAWTQDEKLFQTQIIDKLNLIKEHLINSKNLRFMVTASDSQIAGNEQAIAKFLSTLPSSPVAGESASASRYPLSSSLKSHIKLPFQVGYASTVLPGVPYVHEDGPKLQVLSNLLTFKHLHKEVREKGGAYGGGIGYSALDGLLSFYSYRDPNALQSLSTFAGSGEWAKNFEWTDRDLEEAKLTIFQGIDAPSSVKNEGVALFREGLTPEMRQERRERLLDVDVTNVKEVAEKYLIGKEGRTAVIGAIEGEIDQTWDIVDLGAQE